METPSVRARRAAQVTELFQEIASFIVFAGALDALGGGPQVLSAPLLLGAVVVFSVSRVVLSVVAARWSVRYIDGFSKEHVVKGTLSVLVVLAFIAVASIAWFIVAMGNGFESVAYIATAAVIAAKLATEYEFTVNDQTIIGG